MGITDIARGSDQPGAASSTYAKAEVCQSYQAAVLPLDYVRQYALRRPWVDGYWVNACLSGPLDQVSVRRPEAARR